MRRDDWLVACMAGLAWDMLDYILLPSLRLRWVNSLSPMCRLVNECVPLRSLAPQSSAAVCPSASEFEGTASDLLTDCKVPLRIRLRDSPSINEYAWVVRKSQKQIWKAAIILFDSIRCNVPKGQHIAKTRWFRHSLDEEIQRRRRRDREREILRRAQVVGRLTGFSSNPIPMLVLQKNVNRNMETDSKWQGGEVKWRRRWKVTKDFYTENLFRKEDVDVEEELVDGNWRWTVIYSSGKCTH